MVLLVSGVALWSLAHAFKRVAPGVRSRLGVAGYPVVAMAILASVALMIVGYRNAAGPIWWAGRPLWIGVNNLLMLLSLYLMAASAAKSWVTGRIRHPQLMAIMVWAVAHLLVNGDLASLVLFGGLLAWAVTQVILIDRQDGKPALASPSTGALKEAVALAAAAGVYYGVSVAHAYLGYPVHG